MRTYLPVRTLPVLLLFCLIGLAFHFLPTLGVPSPDVVSFYRFWAAPTDNQELLSAIPVRWQQTNNVPSDILTLYFEGWYPYTGRFDILTLSYFWLMARFFGDNGDIWRLFASLFVSLAIGLFYLIAIKLRVSRVLAWLLALSLFFAPIGWLRGIEAELRAVFFLMTALYLAISSGHWTNSMFSAMAIVGAILTKETFAGAWILIPIFSLYREWSTPRLFSPIFLCNLFKQLFPHIVAGVLIAAFVLYVRASSPVFNDYVFQSSAPPPMPLLGFMAETVRALQPDLAFLKLIPWLKVLMLLFALAAVIRLVWRTKYVKWFGDWDARFALVIAALVIALFFHAIPFYMTSRSVEGRYIAPANFIAAMLIGLVGTPFFRIVVRFTVLPFADLIYNRPAAINFAANVSLLVVSIVALVPPLDNLMMETAQYRVDMNAWEALNDLVADSAPPHAHVVASFPRPSMGETDALMINLLLRGRYDITYHVGDFPDAACRDTPEYCQSYDDFNALQPPLPQDGDIPVVYVNVSGGKEVHRTDSTASSMVILKRFVRSPCLFLHTRYFAGVNPFLEYTVSLQ